MKSVAKALAGLVTFTGVALTADVASAAYEHVCYVMHNPSPSSPGTAGYLAFSVFTGPNCTGTYVNTYYLCSSGATFSGCSTTQRYSEAALLTHLAQLRATVEVDQPVTVAPVLCIGGATTCLGYLYYERKL
jgi:hypothetical protein